MTASTPVLEQPQLEQDGSSNPALNLQAFERGIAQTPTAERRGMTTTGTYIKTGILLAILIAAAAFGWSQVVLLDYNGRTVGMPPSWTWLAFLLTFVLGFAGAFAYRVIAIIAPLYALCQGALLGVAAHTFNLEFDGIVLQAVLATLCVFGATLVLYSAGIIKASGRLAMGVMVAMGALALLYATAWLFALFGVTFRFLYAPTPLGILFSLGIVVLGALKLPLDFEFIKQAAARGAPKSMEWYGAYGLMLSIIWMYVSVLRLLALLRQARR